MYWLPKAARMRDQQHISLSQQLSVSSREDCGEGWFLIEEHVCHLRWSCFVEHAVFFYHVSSLSPKSSNASVLDGSKCLKVLKEVTPPDSKLYEIENVDSPRMDAPLCHGIGPLHSNFALNVRQLA